MPGICGVGPVGVGAAEEDVVVAPGTPTQTQ